MSGGRRLRVEAAVAGARPGHEGRHLAVEAEDGAVDVGLVREHAGVVEQVAGGEVVAAVDHQVELRDDALDVLRGEPLLEGDDLHVGIERVDPGFAADSVLGLPSESLGVDDLPLQVGEVDDVHVDDAERAHPAAAR